MNTEVVLYDGKVIGEILDSKVYVSPRKKAKHLFRNGCKSNKEAIDKGRAAWGINIDVLNDLKTFGVLIVAIKSDLTKHMYWQTTQYMLDNAEYRHMGAKDGIQGFLRLKEWQEGTDVSQLLKHADKIRGLK